tara:strand:+ start:57 stop:1178 length:1122 start_codon:yes stop_codon:yes gene_type:complete
MNKLIFRKLTSDISLFFIISSLSVTLIVWVVQAVNLLDIVSEDGHSIKIYFTYSSLILPKIFSRVMIFIYFISIFYIINKYENSNEILVFWSNGIRKITFINFIFKFSIFFLVVQLLLNLFIVPFSQNIGRLYLKNSNVDYLPSLISEKKFISVFKNLTIFIEKYNQDGTFEKIFIKEKIDDNKSKIITAKKGRIVKENNNFILRLMDGGNTNLEKKSYTLNFSETEYDLSKFSTNTVTHQKIQEIPSLILAECINNFYFKNKISLREVCKKRPIEQISEEMFKRIIIPLYIIMLGLIASSLIIKPKSTNYLKFHKLNIFILGVLIIITSQMSLKLMGNSKYLDLITLTLPIILIFVFYGFLVIASKFRLSRL